MVSSVFSGQQRSTVSTSQYQTLLHTTENSPITDNVHKHRIECSPSKHSGITYGSANHLLINACVFGVPKPVTGSHPGTAVNPGVPQPWFPPDVISLNAPWNAAE